MILTSRNSKTSKGYTIPSFERRRVGSHPRSLLIILTLSVVFWGVIGGRLFYLQLVEGSRYHQLAINNRIRLISNQPTRGRILDRDGRELAGSRLSYAVYVWAFAVREPSWENTRKQVARLLNIPETEIQKRLEQVDQESPFLFRIAQDISPAQVTAFQERMTDLPGVVVNTETVRYYPNNELAAHALGYLGEISGEELQQRTNEGYRLGDVVGQMGVEAAFEQQLRGDRGGQQVEIDGTGQVVRVLGEKLARPGQDVQLTLDLDLQKAAESALGNRAGAIVALASETGEVLAMVSHPAFNPNLFTSQINATQWQQLQSKKFPFVNRALQGYPPASTFKIVTATAALESGRYSRNTVLPTSPYLNLGGIKFWEWNRSGFGQLDFIGAMANSSNTFFGSVGMSVGETTLIRWARKFGLGQKTGIELSGEAHGLVPDAAWKQDNFNEDWYPGDTINFSLGQGAIQATPLQVAVMFAAIANGGARVTPHLKKGSEASTQRQSVDLSPETLQVIQEGLRAVVVRGTGQALNSSSLPPIAGKSGTAEDPPRQSHAWFGAYAPADNPEIVVVAFAENSGGGGGSIAGPMVKQVLAAYFEPELALQP